MSRMRDVILSLAMAGAAFWASRSGTVAALPFAGNVLPYAPPAILLLVGYLGGQLNQSRIFFTTVVLLSAFGVLSHPEFVLPEGLAILALALPVSLALILAVPEGRMFDQRGLLRALLALTPLAALTSALAVDPARFDLLVAWRPTWLPSAAGIPTAALFTILPLAAMTIGMRRDRIGGVMPSILASVPAALGALGAPPGAAARQSAIAFTGAAVILLHGVLRAYWRRAYLDELTGLPNRRALEDELARLAPPYAIGMLDLDRFKRINDRWGHVQGDQVLRFTATHLRRDLGTRVYRYGGEEFCVVFEGLGTAGAGDILERARRGLGRSRFRRRRGAWFRRLFDRLFGDPWPRRRTLNVTLSAGLAASAPSTATPERVRAAADAALYRAKRAGRNRLVVAGGSR